MCIRDSLFDRELSALEVESRFVELVEGGVVDLGGGTIGDEFSVSFAQLNISGGSIGDSFRVGNTFANISGGSIGNGFTVAFESEINFIGSDFFINDVPIDDMLTIDTFFEIPDRGITLSGLLADGTEFSFDLNSSNVDGEDFFDPRSTVGVTLVASGLLGDVDMDGAVDFFDIQPFIEVLSNQGFQAEADIDGNGVVDFLDIAPFIGLLSGQ